MIATPLLISVHPPKEPPETTAKIAVVSALHLAAKVLKFTTLLKAVQRLELQVNPVCLTIQMLKYDL